MNPPHQPLVVHLFREMWASLPESARQIQHDPMAKASTTIIQRTLDYCYAAMSDEGVPEEVRERVLRKVIFGTAESQLERDRFERMATSTPPFSDEALRELFDERPPEGR